MREGDIVEKSIIVYKSITMANRAKRLAEKAKIKASVIQINASFNIKGCSYALSVEKKDLKSVLELSEKYGLYIRAYFPNATPEEGVYLKEGSGDDIPG